MPSFHIIKENSPKSTFRVASVIGKFDLQNGIIREEFEGNIDIENKDWQIGIIYGNSGTGKSTIAKELFNDAYIYQKQFNRETIIDDMPEKANISQITQMFNSVGFSSPPSWLKSYSVLSNGEKMRVDLAYSLLQDENSLIVFDEFTSVVDRNIAKIGSFAVQKAIKKTSKKFIAISCHDDILPWLQPDWIFCTNNMEFSFIRGILQQPEIKLSIFECKREYWELFRKYHYLNHNIHVGAKCYLGLINNIPVSFMAVLHFPHLIVKNMKRCHRLVVLPDYQGIGIGKKMLEYIANKYILQKKRFTIITSAPSLMRNFEISNNWKLLRASRLDKKNNLKGYKATSRFTSSWEYIGK